MDTSALAKRMKKYYEDFSYGELGKIEFDE